MSNISLATDQITGKKGKLSGRKEQFLNFN